MKTRQTLLLGLAGLGFVLAAPVHADPGFAASGFELARRDEGEAKAPLRRESREEPRARGRNPQVREPEHSPSRQDYGYGYERRQQPYPTRDDERGRR